MLVPLAGSLSVISKLEMRSPEAAEMLASFALFEALGELVDANRPGIERAVGKAMREVSTDARRALVRTYVSKAASGGDVDDLLVAAAGLTAVDAHLAKASADDPGTRWYDARDETGRFVARLNNTGTSSGQHREAVRQIKGWQNAGVIDPGATIRVHGTKITGDPTHEDIKAGATEDETRSALEGTRVSHPTALAVHPRDTNMPTGRRGVAFDTIAAATRGNLGAAQRASRGAPLEGEAFGAELDNVVRESSEGDRRAFRQISATGRALRTVSTPGSAPHTAGSVAQLVGELGPQAERVLSPGIRRTAYRYRGTEKRPDPELTREVSQATPLAAGLANGSDDAIRSLAGRGNAGLAAGAALHHLGHPDSRELSHDQLELRLRGDAAVGYLNGKVPTPERTALSVESGRVPPSQGVIIDQAGDVVTEAMGAGSDHYLPFDLKNLKALQGGQYARTRAAGGPTTEDLYTGLMTGARQLQVISNSGVFTVELDPDLRGGRRYSDKARQMIGRYGKILDTIQNSELYTQDVPDDEKAEIKRQAYQAAGMNGDVGEQIYKDKLAEARTRMMVESPSDEELRTAATNIVRSQAQSGQLQIGSRQQLQQAVEDEFRNQVRGVRDQRVQRMQLDGEGYARALDALQEEFPYFIRNVSYETRRDFVTDRKQLRPNQPVPPGSPRARDTGYVRPGYRNVTAFDRHEQGSKAPASSSQAGSAGGGGSAPVRPVSGGGGGGGAGRLSEPVAFKPDSARKLSELKPEEMRMQLADALSALEEGVSVAPGTKPDEHDMSNIDAIGAPDVFVRAMASKHGDLRAVARHLMSEDASPEQLDKFDRGLGIIDRAIDQVNASGDPGDQMLRSNNPKESFESVRRMIRSAQVARKPFAEPESEPALYSPEDPRKAAPQRFDDIDALGDRASNYEGFLAAAQRTAPGFSKAVADLERQPNPGDHVVAEVQKYKKIVDYVNRGDPQAQPPAGVASFAEARNMVTAGKNSPAYKRLQNLQEAWSFLHARSAAQAVSGGGAAPKAPEAGVPMPQFQQPKSEVSQRAPRRRVVVHPPGSPVAKAYQRLRAGR